MSMKYVAGVVSVVVLGFVGWGVVAFASSGQEAKKSDGSCPACACCECEDCSCEDCKCCDCAPECACETKCGC